MKKTIIILIACCTLFSGHAQYQSIFGQNSTFWLQFNHGTRGGINNTHSYTTGLDTLINGKIYKEVTINGDTNYYREDTATGSVFRIYYGFEVELMRMTLGVGDTFCLEPAPTHCLNLKVVDSVWYDMAGRKIIQFDEFIRYTINVYTKWKFIEGIGSNHYVGDGIGDYNTCFHLGLLCSYKDGALVYTNDFGVSCSASSPFNISENSFKQIKIYPSPAKEFIQVEMDLTKAAEFEIYATTGKLVLSGSISPENKIINLSGLSNGLYLLKVENSFIKLVKTN